jgi:hypothetical protein
MGCLAEYPLPDNVPMPPPPHISSTYYMTSSHGASLQPLPPPPVPPQHIGSTYMISSHGPSPQAPPPVPHPHISSTHMTTGSYGPLPQPPPPSTFNLSAPYSSEDVGMSMPPQYRGRIPFPRPSDLTGRLPSAVGPDRVRNSLEHLSSAPSPYRMVYTYAPLRGGETSREEFTDGVIFISHLFILCKTAYNQSEIRGDIRNSQTDFTTFPAPCSKATEGNFSRDISIYCQHSQH